MSTYTVVTTFSPKGYQVYGKKMVQSFLKYWPPEVKLYVCYEHSESDVMGFPLDAEGSGCATWLSLDADEDRARFLEKYSDPPMGEQWDYRYQVATYCHKVFAYTAAPRSADHLIWLDGDTETFAPVTHEFLARVTSPNHVATYLGRPWFKHSETGWLSFCMAGGNGSDFLDEMRRMYVSGDVMNLPETHDCMVFDFVRRKFERAGHRFKNLCKEGFGIDVFEQTPLAEAMRHHKGPTGKMMAYGESMVPEKAPA